MKRWVVVLLLALVPSLASLATDPCSSGALFTASPLDVEDISAIRPLGGVNPPSHVFPTDHIYFYMHQNSAGVPYVVPFYSPGDMTVVAISASQHVKAGYTDFVLELQPCHDVRVVFGHISTLDVGIFGESSSFASWNLTNEYETGGEIYRLWRRNVSIEVSAGQQLGTTGGRRGQYALDLGVYDRRLPAEAVANRLRWSQSSVLTSVCPFDYYAHGTVRTALLDLIETEADVPSESRCFTVFQDAPGTARGCWFVEGTIDTYPEDPHVALIVSNIRPSRYVFSVGTSIQGLASGTYEFAPYQAGVLNRPFDRIGPDGTIYGFDVDGYPGTVIITMPDATTLWIEALPVGRRNSHTWAFSDNKTVFAR